MAVTVFDIETNGIKDFRHLSDLHTIHCLVLRQYDKNLGDDSVAVFQGDKIQFGIHLLEEQEEIVGHNSIAFDIPAIKKLYPWFSPKGAVRDSMVMARLVWPDQRSRDFGSKILPRNLIGSHSLKAWGYRLGEHKGDYKGGWDTLNSDMVDYCNQDTLVTRLLYSKAYGRVGESPSIQIEHDFHTIICEQEKHGFCFDTEKAQDLYATLAGQRADLKERLSKLYPPQIERMKTPEYWLADGAKYKTKGEAQRNGHKTIVKGPLRTKVVPFNPDSRLQIAQFLKEKHGWEPEVFTPSGQPQVDESVLKSLEYEEAKDLLTYLTLSKRIGQLAEGKEAWLRVESNGRIHGRVNSNGTVTGRCTHSRPNLSATPSASSEWGPECRGLFIASPSKVLVGVDLSGLELRCLAHYMARYDGGTYARLIVEGDIHSENQKAARLPTRDAAKTLIYALIYGGGPQKIGSIVGGGVEEGRNLTARFLDNITGLRTLRRRVRDVAQTSSYITALDGRHIPIRSLHSSLNALLQSCGSILTKKATIIMNEQFTEHYTGQVHQVAHVHDEIQLECSRAIAEEVGEVAVRSIKEAGEHFNLRCPLDGEFKIGCSWADTH